jgi:hypothetical protein
MVSNWRGSIIIFGLNCLLWPLEKPRLSQADAQRSASAGFKPASFRGIQIGKAHKADVLRAFGKPDHEGMGEDDSLYLTYFRLGEPEGKVEFTLNPKTGLVTGAGISPKHMWMPDLHRMLGEDYVITRWSSAPCMDLGGFAPIFLDPQGDVELLEYRHLGISVQLQADRVQSIEYNMKPNGFDKNPCVKKQKEQSRVSPNRPRE